MNEEVRQAQVNEQLDRLADCVGMVYNRLEELEQRLGPILRDPVPQPENGAEAESQLVEVAHRVRRSAKTLEAVAIKIEDIMNRLEV